MQKELIYIGDPMCSWCWGFSPVMLALAEQCNGRAKVSVVMGGLHPGTVHPQDRERKDFLRHHWKEVSERTGQPFSYRLLERNDFVYDTEPPCRAVVTVRNMHNDMKALQLFSKLQKSFYVDNADIPRQEVLVRLVEDFGLEQNEFKDKFASEEMIKKTLDDFEFGRSLGVTGYPTVVVREDQQYACLTRGYQSLDILHPVLEEWLEK
jgi:putative protein-disulfide isomerase